MAPKMDNKSTETKTNKSTAPAKPEITTEKEKAKAVGEKRKTIRRKVRKFTSPVIFCGKIETLIFKKPDYTSMGIYISNKTRHV